MYLDRKPLYESLEQEFDCKVLTYVTGDRPNMETQIGGDVIDYFIEQLDKIGVCKKISLYLYTRGGVTSAAWNIVNLLRMYCDELQVIVPHKAHSAGTIISLGANEIVMTKQATLSPIDPSLNTALNPKNPFNAGQTEAVSVEAVKGYLEYAKKELEITDQNALADIMMKLSEYVHPLVLGQVYRSQVQIQMLADKLLSNQVKNDATKKKIISFLCSESGSHDYTINRREAENDLGLNIVKPTTDQYLIIKKIYDDINDELQFTKAFEPNEVNGEYAVRRCLLESISGGSDYYITEGNIVTVKLPNGQLAKQNNMIFTGWRHSEEFQFASERGIDEGEVRYESSNEFIL